MAIRFDDKLSPATAMAVVEDAAMLPHESEAGSAYCVADQSVGSAAIITSALTCAPSRLLP